ncbi:hypothetical protein [Halolamina salifodinae]|uniref:GAPS4 PD-(D/E)XK nuclease domain-containing protein n=1 Tax=Halolamina salifodinae TaxID=1202767 RepID=A0A8T4GZH0_9EURY|nr:hypothetical protein [Halolamina salifodinae]MBP1986765.1 hypothetical protein [Halolamina salifodinae]
MAEEQGRAGDEGEERIIALLEGLGWTKRGDIGIDVEYDYKYHPDRGNTYGVDGYMTYNGPYRDKERGLIIESKNVKWESSSPKKFRGWADDTLEKVEAVPESDDFEEYLNFGESRIVNAGILSVWTRDEENYNDETFQGYFDEINLHPKKRRKYQILALGNRELNRLASLHAQFQSLQEKDEVTSIDFFYPPRPDSHSARMPLVSLEYLLSDFVFARAEIEQSVSNVTVTRDVGIVFHFDDTDLESLNFMYQAVIEHGMEDVDELRVYIYDDDKDDIQMASVQEEFRNNGRPSEMTGKAPDLKLKTLRKTNYADHADTLREE